jgi:hypothetical protein
MPINFDRYDAIPIPDQCRREDRDCVIEFAGDKEKSGVWAQHGTLSQHFAQLGDVTKWLLERHLAEFPEDAHVDEEHPEADDLVDDKMARGNVPS